MILNGRRVAARPWFLVASGLVVGGVVGGVVVTRGDTSPASLLNDAYATARAAVQATRYAEAVAQAAPTVTALAAPSRASVCTAAHYNGATHTCTRGDGTLTRVEARGAVFTVGQFRVGHLDHTVLLEVDAWTPHGWPAVFTQGYVCDDSLSVPLPHIVHPLFPGFYRFDVTTERGQVLPLFVTIRS